MKVLYVRNLNADITEETLKEKFEQFGKVERVKKIKDYGFVHFEERDDAVKAMEAMNGEVSYLFSVSPSALSCSLYKEKGDINSTRIFFKSHGQTGNRVYGQYKRLEWISWLHHS